ncbi:MAG TPA: DinB family protein [Casimicrobiaceae bacterium]|nr:DinB family protein [Casimicrobiaceae bacterium]
MAQGFTQRKQDRGVRRRLRQLPTSIAAVHLYQHATHHRGQLTTLLKQTGKDPGITDLPYLPGVVRIVD